MGLWEHKCFLVFLHHVTPIFFHLLSDSNRDHETTQQHQLSCQSAAAVLSVGRRGWWELWGAVRKHVALLWSHSSSLFGLSCIRAPLLPRFTRGNLRCTKCFSSQLLLCAVCVQVSVSSQSGASKLHLEQTLSRWPSSVCLCLYSAGCHGRTADSGPVNTDQESWLKCLLQLWNWPVWWKLDILVPEERNRNSYSAVTCGQSNRING